MFWNRRNRHLTDDQLSGYLDGELSSARRGQADAHIESCSQCSTALDELRQVASLVSRLPQAELPRSFVLTPQMAGMAQQRPAPRRSSLVFAPAAAFTVLVALFAVDLASSGSVSRDESSAVGEQAMVAKDTSSAAGAASESAERASTNTLSSPATQPTPSQQPALIPPPATGGQDVSPDPSVAGPTTAQGITPPTPGGPTPPATGPGPAITGPTPPGTSAPRLPAPSTGGGPEITSQAEPAAGAADSFEDGQDADGSRNSVPLVDGGGTDWLRIGQVLAAIIFIASLAVVFGPGLFKKGS